MSRSTLDRSKHLWLTMLRAITMVARPSVIGGRPPRQLSIWSTLAHDWYKLNPYVIMRVDDGTTTCGGTARNALDGWILDFAKAIGVCLVLEGELWRSIQV
ncbi:hypothetical protein V6N11_020500 [Hibiscus sabdariffa]|uniref:Uncharacterized protein n=1 Tax=Hibiscus sabdariffa TaxID=183260 RepID=A0ABR2Q8Y5_9ROSI